MPRRREKRMDAAIDHFAGMGYRSADVRRVVNRLLKDVYGKDGWLLLEDSCYSVVQEALFEMEEQEKQQQNEDDDGDDEGEEAQLEPQQEEVEEEAPQQEAAIKEEPLEDAIPIAMVVPPHVGRQYFCNKETFMQHEAAIKEEPLEEFVPIAMVVPPPEAVLAVEQTEEVEPLLIVPPSPSWAASPDPLATGTRRKRPPCYGWISESESESDYEEYPARRQQRVQFPAK